MKKYIFLTYTISGYSGNPRYVNNKCRLLKEKGWAVDVFYGYNLYEVDLEHLLSFDGRKYAFHELFFYPSWFSNRRRNAVVNKIAEQIGAADHIVIESNGLQLSAWGELIAKKLNAKHIVFITAEKVRINNRDAFEYYYSKLKRGEFFTINIPSVSYFFSKYKPINQLENYYWSASPGVEVKRVSFPLFDGLPPADFTISHFGRTKGYIKYMLDEFYDFASNYPSKSFNFFFLGDLSNISEIKKRLSLPNVRVTFHPAVEIVPLQFITKSDIIVATAGCAKIASRNGGKVISMDVDNCVPLGLLGYTTTDSNVNSGKYENNRSLSEWLQVVLIDKVVFDKIADPAKPHQFDYQMNFATFPDGHYFDTTRIRGKVTRNDNLWILLSKIGLFRWVDKMFIHKKEKTKCLLNS